MSRLVEIGGQLVRFGISTGFSAAMSFGLPIVLHGMLGMAVEVAVAIGFATAYAINIVLLRLFVFRSRGSWLRQLAHYIPTNGAFRVIEYLSFLGLFRLLHVDYRISIFVVLATSSSIKFFVYRIIFRDR